MTAPYHSCPFLVKHLTNCIPAIGGVLFVFVVITLLQTSFTDPGILPRATPAEAADIERQIGKGQLCHRWGQIYVDLLNAFDIDFQHHKILEFLKLLPVFPQRSFPASLWN